MKKTSGAKFLDSDLPPPTLSSGEGEEIPLDGKAAEAAASGGGFGAGGGAAGGAMSTPVPSTASSMPPAGPATSTPLTPQPKSLKTRLDQLLSPHPRFGRPDGRLFSPRGGFVGLSNENDPDPPRAPPPGRFFVALAIILALLGVALLIAVVVYNTRHIDRLFQELEENKHKIVPADVHDPAIEPLRPSPVSYVNWPLSDRQTGSPPTSKEPTSSEEKTDEHHTPIQTPLGKASFPDLKVFLEQKYPWNESNPVNAVVTGTFGTVKGTLDLSKIGDIIHAHTRKKRQAPTLSFMDRQTLRNLRVMKDELVQENEKIVNALHSFKAEVKDLQPPKMGLYGMGNPALIELAKNVLKKRDPPLKRARLRLAIDSAVSKKDSVSQKSIDLLVEQRVKNINLIGEIMSISDILENGHANEAHESGGQQKGHMNSSEVDLTKMNSTQDTMTGGKMNSTEAKSGNVTEIQAGQTSGILPSIVPDSTTESIQSNEVIPAVTDNPAVAIEKALSLPGVNDSLVEPEKTLSGSNDTLVAPDQIATGPLVHDNSSVESAKVSEPEESPNIRPQDTKEGRRNVSVESTQDGSGSISPSVQPTVVEEVPKLSPAPTVEMDLPLIQMGREGGPPLSLGSDESAERSEKQLEIEKVELQENLQSMENATNDSELARATGKYRCPSGYRSCHDRRGCLMEAFWCDGKVDCPDSSDEMFCSCRDRVDRDRHCDGYFDCPNGEDELGCLGCAKNDFNCGDFDDGGGSSCAPMRSRCDGVRNCPSGKDEQSCSLLADGILVGVPGQLAAVSASRGVLHHNWHGKWLPVCWTEADIEWALAVCREVVSPNITLYDVQQLRAIVPAGKYRGQWISLSQGVNVQDECEFASYVRCPAIGPGTRVPPAHDPSEAHWDVAEASGTNYEKVLAMLGNALKGIEAALNEGNGLDHALEAQGIDPSDGEAMQHLEDLAASFSSSGHQYHDDVERPARMVNGRVVGGSPSRPGAWPWVVALYEDGKFTCGGAVLNEDWVLTAGHCVQEAENRYLEVQAGMLRRSDFSPTEQTVSVDRIAVNRKFNFNDLSNDIAMLHLSPPLKLNRWVRPILLPSSQAELKDPYKFHITDPERGHKCTVVGWGATAEYGPTADNEREVEVPVKGCSSAVDRAENEICAGVMEGGRDSCQGDSGGPLLCSVPQEPALWFAAGIVSHGQGCGRPRETGAYTRVSDYVDWINDIISGHEEEAHIKYPHHTCPGYQCNAGTKRCIPRKKRCDKTVDCLHADDEEGCGFNHFDFYRSANDTPGLLIPPEVPLLAAGYQPYKPTGVNEPVQPKAAVDDVVDSVHQVVSSVQSKIDLPSTGPPTHPPTHPPATTPSPVTPTGTVPLPAIPHLSEPPTTAKPAVTQIPVVFPGPKDIPKPASFPPPPEPLNVDAEKAGPPPPVGEPVAPPPTEQINPPDTPVDGQDLIPTESDGKKPKPAVQESSESSTSSSTSSYSSSSESAEESAEEPKPPAEKPQPTPSDPAKPHAPEPPPIPVLPVPPTPAPQPALQPPYIPDFDPNVHFRCANMRQKIPKERYCDGIADCVDSSDESKCTCRERLQTLGSRAICDGLTDCIDGTDEQGCDLCPAGQIRCGLSLPAQCVPESAQCDGVEDCPRGEDEEGCLALTDGMTVIVDRDGLPVVRQEGVVARKKRGVWKVVCGLSRADRTSTAWAFDACKDLGYNDFEGYNETSVVSPELAPAVERTIPLVGPAAAAPAPPPPPTTIADLTASRCSSISVRCSPHIDGTADRFLVADGVHAWPWMAELLVDGVATCAGVLVHPRWVVTSYGCTKAAGLDINRHMLTVLMGGPRSELGVLEPFEQLRRADDIRLIPNTDILMVRLATPFIETRHVRPTGLPDWFEMARRALTCVAVGRGLSGSWESLILQHDVACPQGEGLGKTCFTPLTPNAGCTTNETMPAWSGSIVCRARKGWYPAAVFHEPSGRCGLAGTQAHDALFYSLRTIRTLIDGPVLGGVGEPACAGFRCAEGTCLPAHAMCDGVPQCRDARDENPELCAALKHKCDVAGDQGCVCGPGEAQCAGGGGCIPLTAWCDGKPDCPDGSDEATTCTCADLLRAAAPHRLCDGTRNCADRTDESPAMCPCDAGKFVCASTHHCVSSDVVCDGYADCPNGEDEQKCHTVKPFNAPSVSYNAFGEVMRRSYGLWHEMCAPSDAGDQASNATAACAGISLALAGLEAGPRLPDPTRAPVLFVDPFSDFFLTNRSAIPLRGDRPLALVNHAHMLPNECPALRVTCN